MSPDLVDRAARALYGDAAYKARLADALGVAPHSMRRWCSGREAAPSGLRHDLLTLVRERGGELSDIERDLCDGR